VLDRNGDQSLDPDEITDAAGSLKKLDADHDGKIVKSEMLPAMPGGPGGPAGPPRMPGPNSSEAPPLPPVMKIFEPDAGGTISAAAIARAAELLPKLDRDGDGRLAKSEFLNGTPDGAPAPGEPRGPTMPPALPPFIDALDANRDSFIDAHEMAQAPASLARLDRDGDGRLARNESLPPPPGPPGPPGLDGSVPGSAAAGGLFRAVRFGMDFPAFKGRVLAPLPQR
jgi:Ca2+-binding EF-hand superfamily protein